MACRYRRGIRGNDLSVLRAVRGEWEEMTYNELSPIVGPSTPIDLDKLIAWAVKNGAHRTEELEGYFTTLKQGADALGLDFGVLAAQWDLETDTGKSPWWRDGLNPAGLGITGDPKQNAQSQTWADGRAAAQGHLAHMAAYVYGDDTIDHWPSHWPKPSTVDRRFEAPIRAGYRASRLSHLNGTWAIDPQNNYHGKLADRANRIVEVAGKSEVSIPDGEGEDVPMESITFGRVPMYGYTDRQHVTAGKPEGIGWDNLGQRMPKFIALHRMLGSLKGTDGYFGDPTVQALTDFGIGVEAMDGKALAGHIYQWNDPLGHRSGWASGRVSAPYGDGKRIVDKYGVIAVNRDGVSVEISGKADMPIDDFSWGEIVHLCAWWVDYMRIPYNTRTNPATGINYLIWHEEFTIGTGKQCPFDVVKAQTNRLYNDIAAFLKPYQTGQTGEPEPQPEPEPIPNPAYAQPRPIPELVEYSDYEADSMKAVVAVDGHDYVFVNDRVRATKQTPRLQTANRGARRVGPDISRGYEFDVVWLFAAKDGRKYYLTENWTRVLQEDTERIRDAVNPSNSTELGVANG